MDIQTCIAKLGAIDEGVPFAIRQNNCLQCGNCFENCPTQAIEQL